MVVPAADNTAERFPHIRPGRPGPQTIHRTGRWPDSPSKGTSSQLEPQRPNTGSPSWQTPHPGPFGWPRNLPSAESRPGSLTSHTSPPLRRSTTPYSLISSRHNLYQSYPQFLGPTKGATPSSLVRFLPPCESAPRPLLRDRIRSPNPYGKGSTLWYPDSRQTS